MSIQDALHHLDDALDALTTEGYIFNPATGEKARIAPIACTIAINLERVDAAIGKRGDSMFATLAEEIKRAVIAIVAAKESLIK